MDNKTDDNKRCDGNVDQINDGIDKSDQNVERQQTSSNSSELSSSSPSSSWWGGWIQSAKDKSCEAYEFLKKDLNELKETVQNDTAVVVSNTASYVSQTMRDTITGISNSVAPLYEEEESDRLTDQDRDHVVDNENSIKQKDDKPVDERPTDDKSSSDDWTINLTNKAKQKLNALMGSIADALVINRNYYEDDDEMYVVSGDKLVAIDRWKSLLTAIQTDPKTYCHEPSGPPEHYESWLMTFNLIDYERQMDHLLQTVPEMKQFYSELVPNSLSDVSFWHRYYYKVHQIRESEINKIEAKCETSQSSDDSNRNNKLVEIKLLQENTSSFASDQLKQEIMSIASNECSDVNEKEDLTPSPNSTETGSEGWEKTDINEIGDDSKNFNEKSYASDEDIKDWVKYE